MKKKTKTKKTKKDIKQKKNRKQQKKEKKHGAFFHPSPGERYDVIIMFTSQVILIISRHCQTERQ